MPVQDGEIRTVWDYEDKLDSTDRCIAIEGQSVVFRFNSEYKIELANCKTPTKTLIEAFRLVAYLRENEPGVLANYAAMKFISVVRKPLKLPHNLAETFDELSQTLDIVPKKILVQNIPVQINKNDIA